MNGDEEGGARGEQGDAQGAVVGGDEAVLPYPAAQQVLDGGGLGGGLGFGMIQRVGGGAAQPLTLPSPSNRRGTDSDACTTGVRTSGTNTTWVAGASGAWVSGAGAA
nr:hypothetical protein [Streptomyces avermitilis]